MWQIIALGIGGIVATSLLSYVVARVISQKVWQKMKKQIEAGSVKFKAEQEQRRQQLLDEGWQPTASNVGFWKQHGSNIVDFHYPPAIERTAVEITVVDADVGAWFDQHPELEAVNKNYVTEQGPGPYHRTYYVGATLTFKQSEARELL